MEPAMLMAPILATALAAVTAGAAQQLPGLVAPGPNACLPGTGSRSWCGDGGPATRAKLAFPTDVAVAADGSLVIADAANNVVRRVTPDGAIGTLAGNGRHTWRPPRDVARASRPRFSSLLAVAVMPDGSVLVADNRAIRRISHDGRVTIVLGGPRRIGRALGAPTDVLGLPNGDILVADSGNRRVLRRTAAGAVEVVAGSGEDGSTGDGGPATAATFRSPSLLALQPDGGLLIGDPVAGAIRRVDSAGTIATVAHTAPHSLTGLAVAPDGTILAALSRDDRRRSSTSTEIVRLDGTAARMAGVGSDGFTGDGPATTVALDQPRGLAIARDGALLIADAGNDRIRRLSADGRLATVAGSGRPGFEVASLPAPPEPDTGPGTQGRARMVPANLRDECYDRDPRFQIFNFAPPEDDTLPPGRPKVTLFIQTSVMARVLVVIRRGRTVVRRRVLERVSNKVEDTPVTFRLRPKKGRRYFAEMDGRSLEKPVVYRCDRRRLSFR